MSLVVSLVLALCSHCSSCALHNAFLLPPCPPCDIDFFLTLVFFCSFLPSCFLCSSLILPFVLSFVFPFVLLLFFLWSPFVYPLFILCLFLVLPSSTLDLSCSSLVYPLCFTAVPSCLLCSSFVSMVLPFFFPEISPFLLCSSLRLPFTSFFHCSSLVLTCCRGVLPLTFPRYPFVLSLALLLSFMCSSLCFLHVHLVLPLRFPWFFPSFFPWLSPCSLLVVYLTLICSPLFFLDVPLFFRSPLFSLLFIICYPLSSLFFP